MALTMEHLIVYAYRLLTLYDGDCSVVQRDCRLGYVS